LIPSGPARNSKEKSLVPAIYSQKEGKIEVVRTLEEKTLEYENKYISTSRKETRRI
jgi:hypothetical protein